MVRKRNSYVFPATVEKGDHNYGVCFCDLPGCVSVGNTLDEALHLAKESLALHLWGMEEDEEMPPVSSSIKALASKAKLQDNETFFLVDAFMPTIREKMAKRFVKKTLSIPSWLNAQAENYGINFSQTLQKALKQELANAR